MKGIETMDQLQIKGGKVVDGPGNPVFLRGVNIGGWLNFEHFLSGFPGSEANLRRLMQQKLGEKKAAFFLERFLDHFFNENDVKFLAKSGVNAIRLPLNYRHFESDMAPFEYMESGFKRVDQALEWCEKHSIYVILDLHSVPGWQNGDWHCDNSSRHALFWSHKHFQDRFVGLWEELARRYRDRAVVAGYNLVNEPLTNAPYGRFLPDAEYQPDWEIMNQVYRRTTEAIRKIDPKHIIIVEGDYYSMLFKGLEAPFDPNLMYSNHNYIEVAVSPIEAYPLTFNGTYWDERKIEEQFIETEGFQFAQTHNVPLYVGEFGLNMEYPSDNVVHKVNIFRDHVGVFNRLDCHWTFWSYKDLGVMGWLQTAPDSLYNQTIKPLLQAKTDLGVDFGWLAGFIPEIQEPMTAISEQIVSRIPGLDPATNFRYLSQAAMAGYAADQLQNLYVAQFVDKSEAEIDAILASFDLSRCIERKELGEVIRASGKVYPTAAS
jgi:endoglucanase